MQWTDDLKIETPEQIDVALELAGLGSRFLARVIDWGAKWGTLVLVAAVAAILAALLGGSLAPVNRVAQILLITLGVGLLYAFLLGYDIYFEVRQNGQTPGKRRAGIRVLRDSGAPVDFRTACIRNLLGMADFLPLFYFLGAFLILLTSRHQRLGDIAAGTLVVRERIAGVPGDVNDKVDHLASKTIVFTAQQLSACLPEGRHILRSFFQRYGEMEPDARRKLARRLAENFLARTSYPLEDRPLSSQLAETFLASLCRDLEHLVQHGR